MRRLMTPGILVLVAALAIAGVLWVRSEDDAAAGDPDSGDAETTGTTTAEATKRTLTDSQQVTGKLEYADSFSVLPAGEGTLTHLPDEGSVVKRGQAAYRIDDIPVPLLIGDLPMWRPLSFGVESGKDVKQLERNLKKLGYDPGTVNQEFSEYTQSAIYEFQEDRGLEQTGAIDPTEVVVAPSEIRVGAYEGTVGMRVGGGGAGLYTASSTEQIVSVELDPNDEAMAEVGAPATVTLPGGDTVSATVSSVSEVENGQAEDGSQTSVLPVTLTVDKPKKLKGLGVASVNVELAAETKKNALAVPVTALVALAEGGFGVQKADGGLTGVKVGLYADGFVEITKGLSAGDGVEVPE